MGEVKVEYGVIHVDQAALIQGLAVPKPGVRPADAAKKTGKEWGSAGVMGKLPEYLIGSSRVYGLHALTYNLMKGREIVFRGKGKHALDGILKQMANIPWAKVQCGIYPGMDMEKFVPSPFGGGDDQITVKATERDISRVPYYVHIFKEEKSEYHFDKFLFDTVTKIASGVGSIATPAVSTAHSANWLAQFLPDIVSLPFTLREGYETVKQLKEIQDDLAIRGKEEKEKEEEMLKALAADKVILTITARRSSRHPAIVKHSHTRSILELSKDVIEVVIEMFKNK